VTTKNSNPITSSTDADYQIAYALAQKGIIEPTDAKPGKPRFGPAQADWVWLPNTLVDGFGEYDSPLGRLRQIQNAKAIPLLLDCYRIGNLAENAGLSWTVLREKYKRVLVGQHGHFAVWGFAKDTETTQGALFKRFMTGKSDEEGCDTGGPAFWGALNALRHAGLLEYVGHIVEGISEGAQIIHPYALPYEGEEAERKVREAAHEAGSRMVSTAQYERAKGLLDGTPPWLCPVRSHVSGAELVGIARPVHRPHTKRTAAWAANFLHECVRHEALFHSLAKNDVAAAA
jgi:hypothetical protein